VELRPERVSWNGAMVLLDGLPHHRDTVLEPLDVNWDHVSIELAEIPEIDHVLGIGRIENKETEVRTLTVARVESMPSERERRVCGLF
jgi:hypothetical protein